MISAWMSSQSIMFPGRTEDVCIPAARTGITRNWSVIYLQCQLPVIQEIFMWYQKKVVRKSLYQKAIDLFRIEEQMRQWTGNNTEREKTQEEKDYKVLYLFLCCCNLILLCANSFRVILMDFLGNGNLIPKPFLKKLVQCIFFILFLVKWNRKNHGDCPANRPSAPNADCRTC